MAEQVYFSGEVSDKPCSPRQVEQIGGDSVAMACASLAFLVVSNPALSKDVRSKRLQPVIDAGGNMIAAHVEAISETRITPR